MTPERKKELRETLKLSPWSIMNPMEVIAECLDEIARLKATRMEGTKPGWIERAWQELRQHQETPNPQGVSYLAEAYLERAAIQDDHIRRLREALQEEHQTVVAMRNHAPCSICRLLAETEPDRGYQPRNPTPLDPMKLKPPTGGSGVVEPR